ncbi:MAG: hypothetical protein ABH846_00840 [Patescibacteria group bacterium]
MKRQFEARLHTYGDLAKDIIKGKDDVSEGMVDAVLAWLKQKGAEKGRTSEETQEQIFRIQIKKQEVMKKLKQDLKNLSDPEHREELREGARPVRYEDGVLFANREVQEKYRKNVRGEDEKRRRKTFYRTNTVEDSVTVGELISDGEWGIDYQTDVSVPKIIRKQYLVRRARREIERYLDDQILLEEIESDPTSREHTYREVKKGRSEGREEKYSGFLAEKMMQNFLIKLEEDLGAGFKIVAADVYQDVRQKIDFIIRRRKYNRGVSVEDDNRIGVQFTINTSPQKQEIKQRQIEKAKERLDEEEVDDIVLVTIPLQQTKRYFAEWCDAGKPPGGPDKRWEPEVRQMMLRGVLQDFMEPEEIDALWEKMKEQG